MLLRLDDVVLATRPLSAPVPDEALAPAERGLADGAPDPSKSREIRATRAAAREAFGASGLPRAAVLVDDRGRPRVEPPGSFAALAATDALAAAAVSFAPVGLGLAALDAMPPRGRLALAPDSERPWDEALLLGTARQALENTSVSGHLRVTRLGGVPTALLPDRRLRWFETDGHLLCLAGPLAP